LWNSYVFFCNYARLDAFDPAAAQVPLELRPDIDRWILSDLQLLVQAARREFEHFNMMTFCLQAEQFVDDRLSNWYIRRNRRRFWKSEKGEDKLAAYQTLYTVLMTLAKLFAPLMPFLSEAIYQNLIAKGSKPNSVHLTDFPAVDESLIDADLSADMEALLRLVSLGSAARNTVKIKVRQPLAELRVQPADERERRAVARFSNQVCEELNIKRVTLHEAANGSLLSWEIKANPKTLGPKFGTRMAEVKKLIESRPPEVVSLIDGSAAEIEIASTGGSIKLDRSDLFAQAKAAVGWSGVADRETQIAIDTRITEELAQEGMAREVVRHVQDLRKKAGLEMEDRIELSLCTEPPRLQQAIEAHKGYICNETLAVKLTSQRLSDACPKVDVKVEGQALTIQLRKVR
jgi:isoleucyl-tRNA synthetase